MTDFFELTTEIDDFTIPSRDGLGTVRKFERIERVDPTVTLNISNANGPHTSAISFDFSDYSGSVSHRLANQTDAYADYLLAFSDTLLFESLTDATQALSLTFEGSLTGFEGTSAYDRDLVGTEWYTVEVTVTATNLLTNVVYFETQEWTYGDTKFVDLSIPTDSGFSAYRVDYVLRVAKDNSGGLDFEYVVGIEEPNDVLVSSWSGAFPTSREIENIIVLTHGWQPFPLNGGLGDLREAIEDRLTREGSRDRTLIIEHAWPEAHTLPSLDGYVAARGATAAAGWELASSLDSIISLLDPGASERATPNIHFIGHSLGTMVNAHAANQVSLKDFVQQVTVLDSPLDPEMMFDASELADLIIAGVVAQDILSHEPFFKNAMGSENIGYVDNYYGGRVSPGLNFDGLISSNFGQPIFGMGPGSDGGMFFASAGHSQVIDRYAEIVQNGNWHSPAIGNLSIPLSWPPASVPSVAVMIGQGTHDVLSGTPEDDLIFGLEGADSITGAEGNDTIVGGTGSDAISGDGGADHLIDGVGADAINGGAGADLITLLGGNLCSSGFVAFNASSSTQVGTDVRLSLDGLICIEAVTDGGADADIVQLSEFGDAFFLHDAYSGFHDSLALTTDAYGNESTARFANIEEIRGMGGDDLIDLTSPDYSLAGIAMTIDGGEGNDIIWGSDANETILGGIGDDTIFGGAGINVLTGGLGSDVFEQTRTSTETTVTDFDVGEGDMLRFYNTGDATFDPTSVELTSTGMAISYFDAVTSLSHKISIDLALTPSEFSLALPDLLDAVEFV